MNSILRIFTKSIVCISVLLLTGSNLFAIDMLADNVSAGKFAQIERLYEEGKIGIGDKVFYNLQAIYAEASLPTAIRSDSPEIIKSATGIILEAHQNWDKMTLDQQTLATSYLTRSAFDTSYTSLDGHFEIHYDTIGNEAVPADDINTNGIPDYVELIGLYADSSYRHYHNNLGYLPPPKDSEDPYVIYLVKIGAYGATIPLNPGVLPWNDYTSRIEIHCSFEGPYFGPNDDPEGRIIGDQKVTCAHEYFHAIQLGYDFSYDNLWWMECTSTYFEDVLFPEVNDNYNYLSEFFNAPDTFLTAQTYHMYSTFIWASYLVDNFGIDLLRSSWEYARYYDVMPSIDSALYYHGESAKMIFDEFALWNYFTSDRADPSYHSDGIDYPPIEIDQVVTGFPMAIVEPVFPPDGLGANYIVSYPDPLEVGFFMFHFAGSIYVDWGLTCLFFENGSGPIIQSYPINHNGLSQWGIYDYAVNDSLVIIPSVVSRYLNNNEYSISVEIISYGDVDFSGGDPDILDIVFLINQIYKNGSLPEYDLRMSDIDCNESVDILDIVFLINSIYKDGTTPGPCRY
ncbi:MAG: hypothetical protein GY865_08100 [candidate division Zixibacteria bacterium]|nr:hypothetical protein [candidate division Zixibacteria bacterium]